MILMVRGSVKGAGMSGALVGFEQVAFGYAPGRFQSELSAGRGALTVVRMASENDPAIWLWVGSSLPPGRFSQNKPLEYSRAELGQRIALVPQTELQPIRFWNTFYSVGRRMQYLLAKKLTFGSPAGVARAGIEPERRVWTS